MTRTEKAVLCHLSQKLEKTVSVPPINLLNVNEASYLIGQFPMFLSSSKPSENDEKSNQIDNHDR